MSPRTLDILGGTLDVLVLRALSFGPMHGYGVARFIRQGSGEAFRILDGALYTSLHRMEERGWIVAEWGVTELKRKARYYRLSTAGRAQLRADSTRWLRYAATLADVLSAKS